jgi:histidyl-tRNA synthetase
MIRLKDTKHTTTSSFLTSAIAVAEYYGFVPLEDLQRNPLQAQRTRKILQTEPQVTFARRDERGLSTSTRKLLPYVHPGNALLAWRTSSGSAADPSASLELHVMGTGSAVAEAILIVVAHAIADDAGISERTLSINNMGSYESSNRFVRDVSTYLRKHLESISPNLRPKAVEDPLGTLIQLIERGHPTTPRAPQPMEYLTEEERRKFWDLLEYLEISGLQYELNAHILGSRDCWAQSLFEISSADAETGQRVSLAFGGRYDPLASRYAGKVLPAAMVSISCEVRGSSKVKRVARGIPSIYYAHLGPEARRRSLSLLESLRRSQIPVYQGLTYERIGEQMAQARNLATPYIMIMGYKEAMEGTVLLREVATNSQDAVPVGELPTYLKRRRVGNWETKKV